MRSSSVRRSRSTRLWATLRAAFLEHRGSKFLTSIPRPKGKVKSLPKVKNWNMQKRHRASFMWAVSSLWYLELCVRHWSESKATLYSARCSQRQLRQ